ncbi:uncharacterized protein LOC143635069 [Bidens hawaiensis]|uniref:uncharacterized protein LOC143635069 n=1 Tax=Bidens hawaiensis TaxID=980011 RepID=UPI004048F4B1
MVNSRMKEIGKSFEASRSKVMEGHRQHVWWKNLINRVSIHTLGLLVNKYGLIHKIRDGGASCDHHLYSSSGLPCACRIEGYIVNDTCIPIEDVEPFWRRLNFDPACPPNEEPDYAAGLRDITDTLSSIDDPNQKKSFFTKLLSAIPGKSKKKEPEKREDPRGRPKKLDPPRHSAYILAPDLPRHSSYNPSSSQGPSQETPTPSSLTRSLSQSASRFKTPRGRPKTSKPMGAHLGFPLMVSPAQVPAIEMFRSVIHSKAQPFVADIKNVRPDGNCGFRSIAVGLGIHEKVWPDIRRAMQNELETNEGWWRAMFNKEDDRLYGWVLSSIPYSNTVKPAPPSRWFSLPGHGHVAAQTYACVLVNLAGNQTESYFPLRIGPNLVPDPQVIGIANWGGDHWIYINLVGDFPMPTPNLNWERSAILAALEWKTRFGQRLKEYEDIRQGW